jgi:hypothetical protein
MQCNVEYGFGNVPKLFADAMQALKTANFDIADDKFLICYVYFTRGLAPWNKKDERLIWRVMSECYDALELYKNERR